MRKTSIVAIISLLIAVAGCSKFKTTEDKMTIKEGSKVSINYKLTVDGVVVDSSDGRGPLTYTQGSGQIIPGLEKQLAGLKAGDKRSVVVEAVEGYGEHNPDAVQKVPRAAFKEADKLKVGSVVGGQVGGQDFEAVVVAVDPKEITLDLNHPLAGKTLNFDVEVVSVE
jgi:FKBP-type peptidyl-prolyl cis-trans isomerase SlyD